MSSGGAASHPLAKPTGGVRSLGYGYCFFLSNEMHCHGAGMP